MSDDPTSHALNRKVTATVVGLSEQIVEEWTIFTTLNSVVTFVTAGLVLD